LATTKIAIEVWIGTKGRESPTGSNFNSERASCGKFKVFAMEWWGFVTSSVVLKPPVFLSEHILRIDGYVVGVGRPWRSL
jgi:hypothetical protein